jgi:hypothetical protein
MCLTWTSAVLSAITRASELATSSHAYEVTAVFADMALDAIDPSVSSSAEVAHHGGPHDAGQAVFDDAERITPGFTLRGHSSDEGLSVCVGAQPGDGHDVEHRIDATIAMAG